MIGARFDLGPILRYLGRLIDFGVHSGSDIELPV